MNYPEILYATSKGQTGFSVIKSKKNFRFVPMENIEEVVEEILTSPNGIDFENESEMKDYFIRSDMPTLLIVSSIYGVIGGYQKTFDKKIRWVF